MVLGLAYGIFPEVEDRRRQHRGRMPLADAFHQMIEITYAAGGNHRDAHALVSGRSKPCLVPSRSIEVSRISPAPSETTSWAYSTASIPVALRPPWVKISQRSDPPPRLTRLASIATTMH